MSSAATPPLPERADLSGEPKREKLVKAVRECLEAVPTHFASETRIEGLDSGDLFSLNSVLGGTIEVQVVETLNRLRAIWDPDEEWIEYRFARRAQSFPDVRLIAGGSDGIEKVELGIELKGWYLLAKEGEPSFRYGVTPAACAPADLIAVVPWHLKNVLSGPPVVHVPFIEQARYAAEYRNHWWSHIRTSTSSTDIHSPAGDDVRPYPISSAQISDRAVSDSGGNFGRLARVDPLMGEFVTRSKEISVAGIEAQNWISFFRTHAETKDPEAIRQKLARALRTQLQGLGGEDAEQAAQLASELAEVLADPRRT